MQYQIQLNSKKRLYYKRGQAIILVGLFLSKIRKEEAYANRKIFY